MSSTNLSGAGSILLDVIPVLVIILLLIAYLYFRHRYKNEERELKARTQAYRKAAGENPVNGERNYE